MSILYIGDFRTNQIKNVSKDNNNYTYFIDDAAEYTWFSDNAITQLPLQSNDIKSIIINLGFNDCINSCIWSYFNINTIANAYKKVINDIIEQYKGLKFYVCSVSPVDSDYPCAEQSNGVVSSSNLNKKIQQFNSIIKTSNADYIDCYNYLISTGFDTYDGVRYTQNTSTHLLNFISNHVRIAGGILFIPRLVTPVIEKNDINSDIFWLSDQYGGLNPFLGIADNPWDPLPNCVAYVWGRYYEITGIEPKSVFSNKAEQLFLNTADGYRRGQTPELGAIMCWQGGATTNTNGADGKGYVAIVEQINADGSIITSESDNRTSTYWCTKKRTKGSNNNWGEDSNYTFQGFIYCSNISNNRVSAGSVTKSDVTSNNTSLGANIINESFSNVNQISEEMKINARYIWNYLGSRQEENKWTLNAVAGMLGNMQAESTINPGRWQSGKEWKEPADRHGYGLVQWTPYTKFTNWCAEQYGKENRDEKMKDIDAALQRIEKEVEVDGGRWIAGLSQWQNKSAYNNMSFKAFTKSKESCEYLAEVFLYSYERPSKDGEVTAGRRRNAKFWYEYLLQYAPGCGKSFDVINFKTDFILPNEAQLSFLAGYAKTGNYTLYDANNNIKEINKKLDVVSTNDDLKLVVFKCTDLIPDSSYKIVLEVQGNNSEDLKKITLTFKTPQDYPKEVKAVKLSFEDEYVSSKSTFILDVKMPSYIGYWNKECGYELQLIINGDNKKSKIINNIEDIENFKFNIKAYFGYECNTGDIVQINVKTWVKPNGKNKIYDLYNGKTSKAICLLNCPVRAFVNK